eukprot:TRINITY_DN7564_c0_g1_i5.p3 TRINITY_DN7564_c0_g1~~TRINITY_DN7564_c0_g1_i5.p3  ORF type:complete len:132 (-),score=20.25 TRINITY_DN7564_c0_g1_i5:119-514(-)
MPQILFWQIMKAEMKNLGGMPLKPGAPPRKNVEISNVSSSITKNIRFDAMKGKGFYQFCPNLNCIKFGDKDLVFDEDFRKCSSEVESYFSGGSSIYRSKDSSKGEEKSYNCLLYTSPSPRDLSTSRMPSSA